MPGGEHQDAAVGVSRVQGEQVRAFPGRAVEATVGRHVERVQQDPLVGPVGQRGAAEVQERAAASDEPRPHDLVPAPSLAPHGVVTQFGHVQAGGGAGDHRVGSVFRPGPEVGTAGGHAAVLGSTQLGRVARVDQRRGAGIVDQDAAPAALGVRRRRTASARSVRPASGAGRCWWRAPSGSGDGRPTPGCTGRRGGRHRPTRPRRSGRSSSPRGRRSGSRDGGGHAPPGPSARGVALHARACRSRRDPASRRHRRADEGELHVRSFVCCGVV